MFVLNRKLLCGLGGIGLLLLTGCKDNTFTFIGDLPPGFAYTAVANYVPAPDTVCTVTDWRRTMPVFNSAWREQYTPRIKIDIRKVIKGCEMVIRRVALEIHGVYGEGRYDTAWDRAGVVVRTTLEEKYKDSFNAQGESIFYGECQWLFRTMGNNHVLRKLLTCRETDKQGNYDRSGPFAAYSRDQLSGKTITLKIITSATESPFIRNTWIEFPNGWKRCLGRGLGDAYGFCRGNTTDFRTFHMSDGRECTVYPGCKE